MEAILGGRLGALALEEVELLVLQECGQLLRWAKINDIIGGGEAASIGDSRAVADRSRQGPGGGRGQGKKARGVVMPGGGGGGGGGRRPGRP